MAEFVLTPTDDVLFEVRGRCGVVTLNRPRAINALNLAMVDAMRAQLTTWAESGEVDAVALRGAGERGLCAGGDVRRQRELALGTAEEHAEALRFWHDEYLLDQQIADYPLPFVAFMDGLTMGGGVGLAVNATCRVVTPTSKVGMPEMNIGFFPDVGATYRLSRSPGEIGTHLILTGESADAASAIYAGLADVMVRDADEFDRLVDRLADGDVLWTDEVANVPRDTLPTTPHHGPSVPWDTDPTAPARPAEPEARETPRTTAPETTRQAPRGAVSVSRGTSKPQGELTDWSVPRDSALESTRQAPRSTAPETTGHTPPRTAPEPTRESRPRTAPETTRETRPRTMSRGTSTPQGELTDWSVPRDSALEHARSWIDACYVGDDPAEIVQRLREHGDPAAAEAADTITAKSPFAVHVALRALRQAAELSSLRAVLERDDVVARHLTDEPDFHEGVRAQLVDKDRNPTWRHASLADVDPAEVDAVFTA